MDKLYRKRDLEALGEHYVNHVSAMTSEGLHSKGDIAAELAWRDMEIQRLREGLEAMPWRDITEEEPPKDGTPIRIKLIPRHTQREVSPPKTKEEEENICFGLYRREVIGCWSVERLALIREDVPDADEMNAWDLGPVSITNYIPSHWRPIPKGASDE